MAGVFLSYRREDSAGWTGRIYDRVRARFGDERVFLDVEAIAPGEDFEDVIARVLSAVDAVVVMIGPSWLHARDGRGRRRLDDPLDHVRREVAAAIEEAATVVPVLVDGATMPVAGDLPEELRPLVRRNALVVSDIRFEHDVGRLLDMLGGAGLEPRGELPAHNLPAEMTSFVGRAVERREVMSLIETNRMSNYGLPGNQRTHRYRKLAAGAMTAKLIDGLVGPGVTASAKDSYRVQPHQAGSIWVRSRLGRFQPTRLRNRDRPEMGEEATHSGPPPRVDRVLRDG